MPCGYFPAGIVLARIWIEFSIIELPNPLKYVQHCKIPERQTMLQCEATPTGFANCYRSDMLLRDGESVGLWSVLRWKCGVFMWLVR